MTEANWVQEELKAKKIKDRKLVVGYLTDRIKELLREKQWQMVIDACDVLIKYDRQGKSTLIKVKYFKAWAYMGLKEWAKAKHLYQNILKKHRADLSKRLLQEVEASLLRIDSARSSAQDINIFSIPVNRLPWRLLPPGVHPFPEIMKHFKRLERNYKTDEYDLNKLEKIYSLGADRTYIGEDSFEGYVAFVFDRMGIAILDNPFYGNAIYVLAGHSWETLSKRTKKELIALSDIQPDLVNRITHQGDWFSEVSRLIV